MKRIFVVFLIVIIFTSLFACASKSESSVNDSAFMEKKEARGDFSDEMIEEAAMEEQSAMTPEAEAFDGMNADAINVQSDRKLIYYFNYNIETTEFDTDYDFILEKLESVNGYAQNASIEGTKPDEYGERGRYAYLNLRVPIDRYKEFVTSLEGVGNLLSKSQTTDDVSSQYFDTESRIRIIKTRIDKLEGLLNRSTELEDIITLERELSDALYELDQFEGQIRQLDNLIDYTTVSVSLNEVNEITTISQEEAGLGKRIKDAFINTFDGLVRFLEGLLIVVVAGFPIWIIIAVIVFVIVKVRKRRKTKKELHKAPNHVTKGEK